MVYKVNIFFLKNLSNHINNSIQLKFLIIAIILHFNCFCFHNHTL